MASCDIPNYFIYRDVPEGQAFDLTAPLAFFPPKDSDELFDALRASFPHLKSHSERMRDATIQFLMEEREAEAKSAAVSPDMPSLYDPATDSAWDSWPSASMTTLSSPEMTNFATPLFNNSPRPQMMSQQSTAATPKSESQTPAIDQMTSVFSLSTADQPKQHFRRKMTEAEKVEYRKRRIVKACDKCSKKKRKCVHNQPDMEGLNSPATDKSAHKITKPRTNTARRSQLKHAESSFESSFSSFADQATAPSAAFATSDSFGGYEDFTLMMDDPALDLNLDEFLLPHIDPEQTFPPMDNYKQCTQHFNADPARTSWQQVGSHGISGVSNFLSQPQHAATQIDELSGLMFPHSSQIFAEPQSRRRCDNAHILQTQPSRISSAQSFSASQLEPIQHTMPSNGGGTPGELGLPPQPTHTAIAHQTQSPRLSTQTSSDDSRAFSSGGLPLYTHSDGSSTLTAHTSGDGTQRAVRYLDPSCAVSREETMFVRHRLRAEAPRASRPQSELSSTSATSSSGVSVSENAATLEGRPAAASRLQTSPLASTNASRSATIPTPSTPLPPHSAVSQDETNATLSSPRGAISKPTTSRLSQAPLSQQQQQTRAPSALLAQPSPFDRTEGATTRSTELFRLKNRIPASLSAESPAPFALPRPSTAALSSQANGGAYPRLAATTSEAASSFNYPAERKNHAHAFATASSAANAANSDRTTESNGARKLFTESDTVRHRDHHGRTVHVPATSDRAASTVSHVVTIFLAVAVAAMLFVASTLAQPSLLFLAVLTPLSATTTTNGPRNAIASWLRGMRSQTRNLSTKHRPGLHGSGSAPTRLVGFV